MSLTVKHLNSDASFLLSFKPAHPTPSSGSFTILLDPWLSGSSKIWHPKFSVSEHRIPSCISSLAELPEPDLVIISQDKTDHCHEATLKTLPPSGTKTIILAEPASAKQIRSWKHFEPGKVVTLQKWEENTQSSSRRNLTVHRIPLKSHDPRGSPGELTAAFVSQKLDVTGLHSAVVITYRPPTSPAVSGSQPSVLPLTPPASPLSSFSPTSPFVLASPGHPSGNLSVIYSPHGLDYRYLRPFATSHLVNEAALPLTALLHCFDRISNPWYLGGNICAGFPGGAEIAQNLLARYWISAHDGDKDTKGFASTKLRMQRYAREEVEEVVSPKSENFPARKMGTEVVVLGVGEELRL